MFGEWMRWDEGASRMKEWFEDFFFLGWGGWGGGGPDPLKNKECELLPGTGWEGWWWWLGREEGGVGCERLGVKKRRLKHSARLWTWSDFMCPAASQRQPLWNPLNGTGVFGGGGRRRRKKERKQKKKKISGYYNYCHLSFCLLFLRLTPYRAFLHKKKQKKCPPPPLSSGYKKATFWSRAK